jgi:hypothetical protein
VVQKILLLSLRLVYIFRPNEDGCLSNRARLIYCVKVKENLFSPLQL